MFVFNQATIKASSLILLALLVVISPAALRADDLTGLPLDDPKDLRPTPPSSYSPPTGSSLFVSMPGWARGVVMPPLPDQLKPMGGKTTIATTTNGTPSTPPPLAPPKDEVTTITTTAGAASTKPVSTSADNNNQAMITVSPFLQWIKANPQVAAEQARQQANSYHPPAMSNANPPSMPGAGNSGTQGADGDPYWLPPLIDSSELQSQPVGGSAAIYEKPQR